MNLEHLKLQYDLNINEAVLVEGLDSETLIVEEIAEDIGGNAPIGSDDAGTQQTPTVSISALDAVKDEGDRGSTPFIFEITRSGDLNSLLTLGYSVSGTGIMPPDAQDFSAGAVLTVTTQNQTTIPTTQQDLSVSLTVPDGTTGSSLTASGFVASGDIPEPPINIVYVIDVSGSTSGSFIGDVPVGDRNGDGRSDTILDAEIAAYESLTEKIDDAGFEVGVNVAVVPFSSNATIGVVSSPGADGNNNGESDIVDFLQTTDSSGGTDFESALQRGIQFFEAQPVGDNFVFFLSDGFNNSGVDFADEVATLTDPNGINAGIRAIGVGAGASLDQLDIVDDGLNNNSAEIILDPDDLEPQLTRAPIAAAEIDRVEILLNGSVVETIPSRQLISTPLGLRYETTVDGLNTSAADQISARVVANDAGATSTITTQTVEQIDANEVLPQGTVTFAPGEDTVLLPIDIRGDREIELDESFEVTLAEAGTSVNFGTSVAQGVIQNDDRDGILGLFDRLIDLISFVIETLGELEAEQTTQQILIDLEEQVGPQGVKLFEQRLADAELDDKGGLLQPLDGRLRDDDDAFSRASLLDGRRDETDPTAEAAEMSDRLLLREERIEFDLFGDLL